ncbi:hypothetical protein BCV70DRAFT_214069 [Testicularia cyperi]|uniref:DUF202 domain-containing protein n=1 Tax=Testicularia cyperi TaxID=1882483 RepID=A0A317XW62_9BASI|nr:hypothetical protein BCV70DRAFT_214069 [Testicularia cyperi]
MSAIIEPFKSAFRRVDAALSLELLNEGSVARDHLASERTFLAWLRTSLSLVSIGIAITQLFQIPSIVGDGTKSETGSSGSGYLSFQDQDQDLLSELTQPERRDSQRTTNIAKLGKPLGGSFIVLGILVLLLGCYRYFSVQSHLVKGKFNPARLSSEY